jgi:hypothetical protein
VWNDQCRDGVIPEKASTSCDASSAGDAGMPWASRYPERAHESADRADRTAVSDESGKWPMRTATSILSSIRLTTRPQTMFERDLR